MTEQEDAWRKLMREGRFEEAWRVSDEVQRQRRGIDCSRWPRHEQFIWDGSELAGKRVLVRCYHGLGDTIQYVRLLAPLRSIAAEVILWVQPKLIPLLSGIAGADRLLPLHDGAPDVDYDVDVELAELLHALRVTPATLPSKVPYLHVRSTALDRRPASSVTTKQGWADEKTGRRIGLVWRAGEWDTRRSIDCTLLAPFGELQHVEWVLFQDGASRGEWCHGFGDAPRFTGLVEEARALCELDLLVTIDSFPAHLAGALGIPVWTLLSSDPDWRWMRERTDTPWYPSMRLFRQSSRGEWRDVIARVCEELERRCAHDRQRSRRSAQI